MQLSFVKFSKPSTGNVIIHFNNYVGNDLLNLDSTTYKNQLGQAFSVTNFKYYISNIHLKKADGKEFVSNDYFLVREDEQQTKQLILQNIPEGKYISCSFVIGVDSLHNCSGAQTGALDETNGMFWTWNTGYIFLKLEGKSPVSTSAGHVFEFHIGGYKQPSNCIRKVSLDLKNVIVSTKKNTSIEIKTDVSEILKSPVTIDFSKLSSVTDAHNSTTIADNYKDMFSILNVSNEK